MFSSSYFGIKSATSECSMIEIVSRHPSLSLRKRGIPCKSQVRFSRVSRRMPMTPSRASFSGPLTRGKVTQRRSPNQFPFVVLASQKILMGSAYNDVINERRCFQEGFVNHIRFTEGGRKLVCAVGQEHKNGRWWKEADAKNSIVVIPLRYSEEAKA